MGEGGLSGSGDGGGAIGGGEEGTGGLGGGTLGGNLGGKPGGGEGGGGEGAVSRTMNATAGTVTTTVVPRLAESASTKPPVSSLMAYIIEDAG